MKFHLRILYFLCITILISCSENAQQKESVGVQGHRGCRGLWPENSMIGFEKAIDMKVHTLEMDVVISRDLKVVVSHEPFMNHEIALDVNGKPIPESNEKDYNLYEMTYEDIQQYNCGTKQHPRFPNQEKVKVVKPLLEDVIKMAEAKTENSIRYNIEIKRKPSYDNLYAPKLEVFVALVLAVLEKFELGDRVNLQAFDLETLREIKRQAPKMPLALLIDAKESIDDKLKQLDFKPEIISPHYMLLTQENIRNYQKKGFLVIPWTVNKKSEMNILIEWNVDAIITDYPNLLMY
jgi:glycerophosphoryl diester phosphodiesterase